MVILVAGRGVSAAEESPSRRVSFNAGWRFIKDDPADAKGKLAYTDVRPFMVRGWEEFHRAPTTVPAPAIERQKLGEDVPYTRGDFDDSQWRKLDLPHDWGIEGPFKQEYPGETGKLPWWGVGWYRKHFTLSPDDAGKRVSLEIDGAMAYANVWLNGKYVGGWPYGYASWAVDLTPYLKSDGGENVVAIRLDNPPDSSRWYPGGGIYRNVWLTKMSPVHVARWGTTIYTPEVSEDSAEVQIRTIVRNDGPTAAPSATIDVAIYAADENGRRTGEPVATIKGHPVPTNPEDTKVTLLTTKIANPRLWSIEHPNLYVALTTIRQGDEVVDETETTFGVRTIQFTPRDGFLLNRKRVKIQGVCDHHDLGALGTAINTRALQRQLQILKEMGCNAIRTSHNPPAPELLDLCDRMGFVVMDEAFDCWARQKKKNDYHVLFGDWHEADMRALIRRDRNHPCVVLWSIGNEIGEQGDSKSHHLGAELSAIAHEEDPTRGTTSACNNGRAGYNGFGKNLDVFGDNYDRNNYAKFREANPEQPVVGSETASCVSSRGEYFFPVEEDKAKGRSDFQVSSYDLYAPRWAMPPDTEFKAQDENPFCAGEFVWTGFDYLGEPTPFNGDSTNLLNFTDPAEQAKMAAELKELGKIRTPSRSSYFGIVDLAGFKKDRFYIYQARWRPDFPMAHILPHWNWPDRVGQVTPVHVYTSGDEAELFLNDKSLGRKKIGKFEYRLRWDDVKYEPGELRVVAYKDGKEWAKDSVKTTGAAAKLLMAPDRATIHADGVDLSYVTVTVADQNGLLVPRSKNLIKFEITGAGEIAAVDNGDATSFEPFQASERRAYNGLALVIVRSKRGESGTITLKAISDGLEAAQTTISTSP